MIATLICMFIASKVGTLYDTSPETMPRVEGIPNISYTYSALEKCSIDQIVETHSELFVLYGEHKGNVQVFDKNGNYKYSVYLKKHLNGAFRIAANGSTLYVQDDDNNVYVFSDGMFSGFYRNDTAASIFEPVKFNENSANYIVRYGSVWRVDGDERICIIRRPQIAMLYQNDLAFYLSLFFVVAVGVCFRKGDKRTR